ncbi:MAG: hypothetical protein GY715_08010 [Planctomycetes bacterium]|nr:hypothetical protein [Planctomycetota bacterium]
MRRDGKSRRQLEFSFTRFVAECSVIVSVSLILPRLLTGRTPAILKTLLGPHDAIKLAVAACGFATLAVLLGFGFLVQERRGPLSSSLRTLVALVPAIGTATFLTGALVHDLAGFRRVGQALFIILPCMAFVLIVVVRPFRWEGIAAFACAVCSWWVTLVLGSSRPQPVTIVVVVSLVFACGFAVSALRKGPAASRTLAMLTIASAVPLVPLVAQAFSY